MNEFESWRSYVDFALSLKQRARYVFDENVQKFLSMVIATSAARRKELPAGTLLWRAQQGHGWLTKELGEHEYVQRGPLSNERMKPLRDSAREGRVNARRID